MHKTKKEVFNRKFNVSQYKLYPWLTGSVVLNKLYCWPCLLFSKTKGSWNSDGFSDLNNLQASQKKHKISSSHLQSVLDLNSFGAQRIDEELDKQKKIANTEHNKRVHKNREILKRLIDVTCFLGNQELAFRGHDECEGSMNRGNYIELLHLLKNYDSLLDEHLDSATVFKGTSSTIQNDLIMSVGNVINDAIFNEIQEASFVAIMLDETSDIQNTSQLSTILRYVHKGKICEHFLGFTDVSADRSSNGLFNHIEKVVEKYNLSKKLVAQTYDGAAVMSGHLNGLQQKVLSKYPLALHIHCYAHCLNLVLSQSMGCITDCNIFFQTMNGIATFASHSNKRTFSLKEYLKRKIPSLCQTRWSFSSRLINVVHEHRLTIIEYFKNISKDTTNTWDSKDRMAAVGYLKFLCKYKTVFLLNVLSTIYSQTDILFNILQNKNFDIIYCDKKIEEIKVFFKKERESGFGHYWTLTNNSAEIDFDDVKVKRKKKDDLPKEDFYRKLFFEIIDNIEGQLCSRFSTLRKLEIFGLLNYEKFGEYKKKSNFPEDLLKKLLSTYNIFDGVQLRNELMVLYNSNDLIGKSPYQILNWMIEKNLADSFEQVYKLTEIICTIPATTASVERSFSTLKRVKTYVRSTQKQDRLSSLSMISIEKELLKKLRSNLAEFHNSVIGKFLQSNRRLEFKFK